MKTIDLSQNPITVQQLLDLASHENLLLRRDGEEFIIASIDDFDSEIESLRYNAEFISFLNERANANKVSIEEARTILLKQD